MVANITALGVHQDVPAPHTAPPKSNSSGSSSSTTTAVETLLLLQACRLPMATMINTNAPFVLPYVKLRAPELPLAALDCTEIFNPPGELAEQLGWPFAYMNQWNNS